MDSLEEWRQERKLERFTLLGHSLGGYMAVAYALKYPGRLNKLILASPVGIPEDPYAVNADMPEPTESQFASEFTQDQEEQSTKPSTDPNNFRSARTKAEQAAAPSKATEGTAPPPRRPYSKWLLYLWDANVSPFSLVRWAGPLGPRFVSGWTSRRFSHLPAEEAQALHTYAYTLFKQRGSGEYALTYILAPGAFARSPLIYRIGGVGRQPIAPIAGDAPSKLKERGVPVVFVYGENDWMDVAGGYAAKRKIDDARAEALKSASEEEKRLDEGSAKVIVIKNAGHHVYLDGWKDFNESMQKEMAEVANRTKARKERQA